MDPQKKSLEIENERSAEKRYAQMLAEKARRPVAYQGPRNTHWTGNGLPGLPSVPTGRLVGRVALRGPHAYLDGAADFYIGDRYLDLDGIRVFSWAAPVACTYFRGSAHHSLCDEVAVVRSFAHGAPGIEDLADDVVRSDAPSEPFRRRGLVVPAAPITGRARPVGTRSPANVGNATDPMMSTTETTAAPRPFHAHVAGGPMGTDDVSGETPTTGAQEPRLRAESLLRSRLAAPRTRNLSPVLSTLQPDQYMLVTLAAMESIVIEGQPGTGKTIIASHRAAYLVADEPEPENKMDGDVLLIGPTDAYSAHVQGVVDELTDGSERVTVTSLPSLLQRILKLREEPRGTTSRSWKDVDTELGRLALKSILTQRQRKGVTPDVRSVWEMMRLGAVADPEWANYLRALPGYDKALTFRAHLPLLAFIRWNVAPDRDLADIEHIMVDEAQDVTPLEWMLLSLMNGADAWTIIGDLNQRRSDHTYASWQQVAEVIEYPYGYLRTARLERGYRSTKPILEFANRLLPRADRALVAFQEEGPEPVVTASTKDALATTVRNEADRLLTAYPRGTVAVIDVDPSRIRLLFQREGWIAVRGNRRLWAKDGREVAVMHPDQARGLEFDGVVVSEPAEFPVNFGRRGPLYTSLTRPNRELAVVHSKPLPEELRPRKR